MTPAFAPAVRALAAARASVFVLDVTSADCHSLEVGLQGVADATGGLYLKTFRLPNLAIRDPGAGDLRLLRAHPRSVAAPGEGRRRGTRDRAAGGKRGTVLARPVGWRGEGRGLRTASARPVRDRATASPASPGRSVARVQSRREAFASPFASTPNGAKLPLEGHGTNPRRSKENRHPGPAPFHPGGRGAAHRPARHDRRLHRSAPGLRGSGAGRRRRRACGRPRISPTIAFRASGSWPTLRRRWTASCWCRR